MALGETALMGPVLRAEVERQLFEDLAFYGFRQPGLQIDWSDACQDGHCTNYLDGNLEELSDLIIRDAAGVVVADGWMDFVHGGGSNPLIVFWLFLTIHEGETRREVKTEPVIPDHIWQRLPDGTKTLCAVEGAYDAR